MAQFDEIHLQTIVEGVRLFNAQKYWECHENLEDHWLEEAGPMRNIYWAIIQVAAAMIHYREGNLIGAQGLIVKAKQKFDRCEQYKIESALLENNLSWGHLKELVRKIPADPVLSDFKHLFAFRFKDPDLWK
jgi:predicted metal-dependent hydrolase